MTPIDAIAAAAGLCSTSPARGIQVTKLLCRSDRECNQDCRSLSSSLLCSALATEVPHDETQQRSARLALSREEDALSTKSNIAEAMLEFAPWKLCHSTHLAWREGPGPVQISWSWETCCCVSWATLIQRTFAVLWTWTSACTVRVRCGRSLPTHVFIVTV